MSPVDVQQPYHKYLVHLSCMCVFLKHLFRLPRSKLFQTFVPVVGEVVYDMVAAISVAASESMYVAHTSSDS